MLLSWNHKHLFSRFSESCRALLLLTLPGAVAAAKALPLDLRAGGGDSSPDPLNQPFFLSATQDPVASSYVTSNAYPLARPAAAGAPSKKKRGRKKVHMLPDHIPDENKTPQLKALEAFVMKYQQQLEDIDLSGVEDPIILHYIIVSHPSIVAHKEVIKFKRRLQYLEMLVHLLNMTLAKGHHDRVMEWLLEGFQWLSKRNEVLLNPRVLQKAAAGEPPVAGKGKLGKASHLFSTVPSKCDLKKYSQKALTAGQSSGSVKGDVSTGGKHGREHVTSGAEHPQKGGRDYPSSGTADHPHKGGRDHTTSGTEPSQASKSKKGTSLASTRAPPSSLVRREPVFSGGRDFYIRKSLQHSVAAELSTQIRITKEDLEAKSVFVLISRLPEMWRTHKCRYIRRDLFIATCRLTTL